MGDSGLHTRNGLKENVAVRRFHHSALHPSGTQKNPRAREFDPPA